MAIATKDTGKRVQAWISPSLAARLREQAAAERRSVSATIRLAVEDRVRGGSGGER